MPIITLSTACIVLGQIAVSCINQYFNREATEKIKAEQRKAKMDEMLNNHRRDIERFERSCAFQEKLEAQNHIEKMRRLRQDFLNSFDKMLHNENLTNSYRLNVSPYIISRSVMPMSVEELENLRQEVFCVLTSSNDESFNKHVLPYLDDAICDILSQFWNSGSDHMVSYYQNMWNSKSPLFSHEDIANLRILISIPTVAITPFIIKTENGHSLTLKLKVWGMGQQEIDNIEVKTSITFETLPHSFTSPEIKQLVNDCLGQLICLLGQIIDVYYWTNYNLPPLFTSILKDGLSIVSSAQKEMCKYDYIQLYNTLALGSGMVENENSEKGTVVKDVSEINWYNHPKRNVAFLRNILEIIEDSSISAEAITKSMLSLYKAKTDALASTISEIDGRKLCIDDFETIKELLHLSKQKGLNSLTNELSNVVMSKIVSWH